MKRITSSRKQILRAIHAACVALFFAACGHAAAQSYTDKDYTVNGSTVTGDAVTNTSSAYFYDPTSGKNYTVTIGASSILGNTEKVNGNELEFYSGSVNNAGILSANEAAIDIYNTGTVTNTGSISSRYGIYIGGTGTVTNSGSISGKYGVYLDDGGTVINNVGGTIKGEYAVKIDGNGSVVNSGEIEGKDAVSLYSGGTAANSLSVTNTSSGYIHGENAIDAKNNTEDFGGSLTNSITLANESNGGEDYLYGIYGEKDGIDARNNSAYTGGNVGNSITLTNSGSVYGDDGNGANLGNHSWSTYGNASSSITVNNSDYIGGDDGIEAKNNSADTGGNASSSITINNVGYNSDIHGDEDGIDAENKNYGTGYVDDGYTYGNVSNTIAIVNARSSDIYGEEEYGIYAENSNSYSYTNGSASSSITVNNSGSIEGGEDGVYLENNDYETDGNVTNTITLTNSSTGSIYGYEDGIEARNNNADTEGSASNSISLTNSGSISGYNDIEVHFYNNNWSTGGNASNSTTLNNSGYIYSNDDDDGVEVYQNNADTYDGGNASNSIEISNSGYIRSSEEEEDENGISAENKSYETYGNVTNTINLVNTSSSGYVEGYEEYHEYGIFSAGDDIYAENDNQGDEVGLNATNTITLVNSGSMFAHDHGAALYNYNDEVEGNASNTIAVNNTSNAGIYSLFGSALHLYNKNEDTGGNASNTIVLTNAGAIGSDFEDNGIHLTNDNAHTKDGNASNSITVSNSGYIYGDGDGIYATNNNYHTGENATNAIAVYNSGSIYGNGGAGIYLHNHDWDTTGTSSATALVVNTSSGYIYGSSSGIYIDNSSTGTQSTLVINSGAIIGGDYGVYFDTANSTLTTTGGYISGSCDSVYLAGGNSTVNVNGRANMEGEMFGSDLTGNTLNFNLILSPAQAQVLKTDVALAGEGFGTFTDPSGDVYTWDEFPNVNVNALSLELNVDPGLVAAATAIDNKGLPANTGPGSAGAQFDEFYDAAFANPEAAVNELVGREINQGINTLGLSINTTLASDLNEHLDNLLTGDQVGGFDISGLHIGDAGGMYAMGDTTTQLDSLVRMTGSSAFGGTELSTDSKGMVAVVPQQSKWGIWASGDVTLGDESGNNTLSGFHSTLGSPTLGLDYRVAPNLVIGVLGSYTTGDANFEDGSTIGINTEIAALYGTWRDGNWHVNGIAGGGTLQLNDTRTTFGGDTAGSTPRGDDILTDWTGGYDFHLGDRWNITPEVGLQYTHLDIDSFTETGAGAFDLSEGDQNIDSLRSHVGFNLNKAYSLGKDLTFIPELRALWYHEFMDNDNGVSTSLPGAPALGSFNVTSLPPQRDFALVGVGLNTAFTGYKGVPIGLFLNYNAQVGQSDYIANSVNAGIRVDF